MSKVQEIKALVYDEILKKTVAERNIAILEQQLQQELALAEKPVEPVPQNNS